MIRVFPDRTVEVLLLAGKNESAITLRQSRDKVAALERQPYIRNQRVQYSLLGALKIQQAEREISMLKTNRAFMKFFIFLSPEK
ncbi:hypothetical protein QS306_15065 [Paraburkholderia bonniea]|uniref:hypothetical protein n=1 Tax=Paraburkholderia bonniea TaxID=2152891 RepID=UPI002572E46A|nr:hypothetical protein [Paraburkholderia bonniea]WJF92079.1 hypothetical protein QS306_15065 [Paraburkholderia bonniea]WJF95399.1 hypothetical protein QS308_15070 [Paraburkholderia bonniea]